MSRSPRVTEAANAFEQWRQAQRREQEVRPNLFAVPLTEDEAIESVGAHAGDEWRDHALEAVRCAATAFQYLTVDHVHLYLSEAPYDMRSLGSVMREAAKRGWITSTGDYRTSNRPETHSRPLRVWLSQLNGDLA